MIQWKRIAQDLGYKDTDEMWRALYPKFSISQLATRFAVAQNSIRDQLKLHDIARQKRGGKNNQKLVLDEDLLTDIRLRGVITVARERDYDVTSLYKALRKVGLNGKLEQVPKWPGQRSKLKSELTAPEVETKEDSESASLPPRNPSST